MDGLLIYAFDLGWALAVLQILGTLSHYILLVYAELVDEKCITGYFSSVVMFPLWAYVCFFSLFPFPFSLFHFLFDIDFLLLFFPFLAFPCFDFTSLMSALFLAGGLSSMVPLPI